MTGAHAENDMKRISFSILALFVLLPITGCSGLFFYPAREFSESAVVLSFAPQDIYFRTSDGITLHGWFFQPPGKALGTVLVMHGNAQNLSTHVHSVLWLVKEGFNLFIFDYRGYGRSEGTPSLDGIHADAEAALETGLSHAGEQGRIVVLGQSLGGDVAVYAVAHAVNKNRVAALVLESAFAGYRLIAREKLSEFFLTWPFQYPLSYLIDDHYSAVKWIDKVSPVPVLVMQGKQDTVVPAHHGRLLFEAAREPREMWETEAPGHIRAFSDNLVRRAFVGYVERKLETNRGQ